MHRGKTVRENGMGLTVNWTYPRLEGRASSGTRAEALEIDFHAVRAEGRLRKDAAGGGEADGVVGFVERIEMDEDEAFDAGYSGDLSHGCGGAVSRFRGPFFLAIAKVAFVYEQIDATDLPHVVGGGRGRGVGDVG